MLCSGCLSLGRGHGESAGIDGLVLSVKRVVVGLSLLHVLRCRWYPGKNNQECKNSNRRYAQVDHVYVGVEEPNKPLRNEVRLQKILHTPRVIQPWQKDEKVKSRSTNCNHSQGGGIRPIAVFNLVRKVDESNDRDNGTNISPHAKVEGIIFFRIQIGCSCEFCEFRGHGELKN